MKPIEVYEWVEGAPRPGTTEKARHTCIDMFEVPPGGQAPQTGDIIRVNESAKDFMRTTSFRVIERDLMWVRSPDLHDQDPATWQMMCLYVRRLEDDTR